MTGKTVSDIKGRVPLVWGALVQALLLAFLLAGCVPGGGFVPPDAGGALPRSGRFLGGTMRVLAPPGYCIDRSASHDQVDGAVVVMGRCTDGSDAAPALIALTAGAPGSAAVLASGGKALSDYFSSSSGRAALARDGRAGSVRIRTTGLSGGVFVMRVADRRAGEYWRAILGHSGRLVTISVMGPDGVGLASDLGRRLLDQTVAAFESVN